MVLPKNILYEEIKPDNEAGISILLHKGRSAIIREVRSEDATGIQEMHARVSANSLYFRYLHAYKPAFEDVLRISQQNDSSGAAFVAVLKDQPEKVIGLSNYSVDPQQPIQAEPAVIVEDQFQGQGVGRALLQQLQKHARIQGIQAFYAMILPSNRRMLRMVEKSSAPLQSKYNLEYGLIEVRMPLIPEQRVLSGTSFAGPASSKHRSAVP